MLFLGSTITLFFNSLLDILPRIQITIIIANDINNSIGQIIFQNFIDLGGSLFFGNDSKLMHNKYLIIDENTILTGSYNLTYGAEYLNNENMLLIKDKIVCEKYIQNFEKIKSTSTLVIDFKNQIDKNADLTKVNANVDLTKNISEVEGFSPFENFDDKCTKIATKLIEHYNARNIERARKILYILEWGDPLYFNNQRILFAAALILAATGEDNLANKYYNKLEVKNRMPKEFLYYKLNLNIDISSWVKS